MALIQCPDCGKEFSNQAAACPNCGRPNKMKYCRHCGQPIDSDCIICPKCGKQVEELKPENNGNIVINNSSSANVSTPNHSYREPRIKNKWVSFLLCLFLGPLGIHKFYEGKIGMGILYLITAGLCGIGWFIDLLVLLFKPNPYYV